MGLRTMLVGCGINDGEGSTNDTDSGGAVFGVPGRRLRGIPLSRDALEALDDGGEVNDGDSSVQSVSSSGRSTGVGLSRIAFELFAKAAFVTNDAQANFETVTFSIE